MGKYNKLWWTLIAVLAATFALLGYFGVEVYRKAPPIPDRVVSISGQQIMTRESILDGQTVPFGVTAPIRHRTGPPTGFTANYLPGWNWPLKRNLISTMGH